MAALARLRTLDRAELRFRLTGEFRKRRDRLMSAIHPPHWRREDLLKALAPEGGSAPLPSGVRDALARADWSAAHRLFAGGIAARTGIFPLLPRTLPALGDAVRAAFPAAAAEAARRGDRMLAGEYDVLGYTGVRYGTPPDWHRDPVHGRTAPDGFWSQVPYLDPGNGDHKIIWEINRHQHWLGLARAWQLTRDRRYYDAFVQQIEDWMAANAPLQGVNWASMLELAFRAISWVWALHLFADAAAGDAAGAAPWTIDLLLGLDRQLTHVERNLSRYFSPNTHLSGEALGLYVAGSALPELASSARWTACGRRVLLEEIDRQVLPDGGHAERSGHYHRYSTDFYLMATLTARAAGDPAAARFEEAARRQAGYLRTITDASGRLPLLGDDDGGALFPICGRPAADCRDSLSSAAAILDDPSLVIDPAEETLWLCGRPAPAGDRPAPQSAALASSGYYVSRNNAGDHLIFDAGPHGFLNGGHAHADALAVILTVADRPFLVDAGTATYTMDEAVRDRFRSTAMHNTVTVGGRSQSVPQGPFHWKSRTDATRLCWQSTPRYDYVEGTHDGYQPVVHVRAVLALHGFGWVILDHLVGPEPQALEAAGWWHLHPAWRPAADAPLTFEHPDGGSVALASSVPLRELAGYEAAGLDTYAPVYGLVTTGRCLRTEMAATLPQTVMTFIGSADAAPRPRVEPIPLDLPPGPGWHGAAFRLSWDGGDAIVLSAAERAPGRGAGAPGHPWGAASARISGRAAFLPSAGRLPPVAIAGCEPGGGAGRA